VAMLPARRAADIVAPDAHNVVAAVAVADGDAVVAADAGDNSKIVTFQSLARDDSAAVVVAVVAAAGGACSQQEVLLVLQRLLKAAGTACNARGAGTTT
jgi:hypothetical protein